MAYSCEVAKGKLKLYRCRKTIQNEKPDLAGIKKNDILNPSQDWGIIRHYKRINKTIKGEFREFLRKPESSVKLKLSNDSLPKGKGPMLGTKWHSLLDMYLQQGTSVNDSNIIARTLIQELSNQFTGSSGSGFSSLKLIEGEFPLNGYMCRKDDPSRVYFWRGVADAIGWYEDHFVIVDWKTTRFLEEFWNDKDTYGWYLHQCLVYAKLLECHLKLDHMPYILIVGIDEGDIYPGLFTGYPEMCLKELDSYEWYAKKPEKPVVRLPRNFLKPKVIKGRVDPQTKLSDLFRENVTLKDLWKLLNLSLTLEVE